VRHGAAVRASFEQSARSFTAAELVPRPAFTRYRCGAMIQLNDLHSLA
jgi:hypothetical protein